jgi:hypothetical protein
MNSERKTAERAKIVDGQSTNGEEKTGANQRREGE